MLVLSMIASVFYTSQISFAAAKKTTFKKSNITLLAGKKTTLKLSNVVKGSKKVFTSANKKCATVSNKGVVKALKKGKTTITCKITKGKTKVTLKAKVTVVNGAKSISVIDSNGNKISSLDLNIGDTSLLEVNLLPKSSNDKVTWKSNDDSIVKVSKDGTVVAVSKGTATVVANSLSGKKVTITIKVNGSDVVPTSIPTSMPTSTPNPSNDLLIKDASNGQFTFGVAVSPRQFSNQTQLALIKKEYNSITYENDMKPSTLLDQKASQTDAKGEPNFNTQTLDNALSLAKKNGLPVRGHTLVWHSQTPDWFFRAGYTDNGAYVSKEIMLKRMEVYIKKVMEFCQTKYPGVVYAWDVVNEAVSDSIPATYRTGTITNGNLTGSPWYAIVGPEFLEKAFEYADKYRAEGVKLFYNDYNEYIGSKRDFIYDICKPLKEKGILDGIGMQSHWDMSNILSGGSAYPSTDLLDAALKKFASIPGIEIQLTEIDAHCNKNDAESKEKLAKYYYDMVTTIMNARKSGINITNLTIWGIHDGASWLTNHKGESSYPLLFNSRLQRKPSYMAVYNAIKGLPYIPIMEVDVPSNVYSTSFETGLDKFSARGMGATKVSQVAGGHTGNSALQVTGRQADWNGVSLDISEMVATGDKYTFKAYVKQTSSSDEVIHARLQSGYSYISIKSDTICKSGEWTEITGTITIPGSAMMLNFFFEAPNETLDFYVDDVSIYGPIS